MMDLTFVFPCLNEEETLGYCLDELNRSLAGQNIRYEVVIADNGSIDRSIEIARKHMPECRIVDVAERGYGAALTAGIRSAQGEYVIFADADGSYPLTAVPAMYRAAVAKDADMTIASRMTGQIEKGAMPFLHRYLGTPVLTSLINLLYHGKLTDCNSGFRIIRRSAFEQWNVQSSGMEFASELLIKTLKHKSKVVEIPVGLRKDRRSRAPHLKTWRDGMRHLLFILSEAPGFFEKVGLTAILVSTVIQALSLTFDQSDIFGIHIFGIHTKIIALIVTILGVQLYSFACCIIAVSPNEPCLALTRKIINLPQDILFFTLCGLLVLLLGCIGTIFAVWIFRRFSSLDYVGFLMGQAHLIALLGFLGITLLEIHILKRLVSSK